MIAPESANDAKDGGDLVTTLLLGFPQGVSTALFIVALLAWGFLPGPEMIKKNPEMIYSVVWIQGIAGITGTLIGFGLVQSTGQTGPGALLGDGADHIYFRIDGRLQRHPRPGGFVGSGGLRHIRLLHAPLRLSQTRADSRLGIRQFNGEISLPFDGELRVYLAYAARGDGAFGSSRDIFLLRGARQDEDRGETRSRWRYGFCEKVKMKANFMLFLV